MLKDTAFETFQKDIYRYYRKNKRDLPWRRTKNPYRILVSEIMLQQTQVARVRVKYREFIKRFPTVKDLAGAQLKDVLAVWQGLGYNRRAKYLHLAAKEMVKKHNGRFPRTHGQLTGLPGIGQSTAGAVLAFAYGIPATFIETNIRSVYIHYFFHDKDGFTDKELMPLIESTLDLKNPRDWYYALMDYGVYLKKLHANPSRKSAHHTRQSRFEGSRRQVRGQILRLLLVEPLLLKQIAEQAGKDADEVRGVLNDLVKESLVKKQGARFTVR